MTLLTVDWPAWFSYEWWRDVGFPVVGVLASTFLGVVAVLLARRSNALSKETADFAKVVKDAEDQRSESERGKASQRERVEFVLLARRFNFVLRKDRLGEHASDEEMDADMYEAYLREVAATLDDSAAAEDVIERILVLFARDRFPDDGQNGDRRRMHAWAMWRASDVEIRAFAAGRPLSDLHPYTYLPRNPPSTPELQAEVTAWRERQDARRGDS